MEFIVFWGYIVLVLIFFSAFFLSYFFQVWDHLEAGIITVVYFALAYAFYIVAVKDLANTIEEKYFITDYSAISSTVVALSLTAFFGLTRLIRY